MLLVGGFPGKYVAAASHSSSRGTWNRWIKMKQRKLAATLFSVSAGLDWIHKTMSQVNATHHDSADCRRRHLRLICLKSHCAVARWHSRKFLCKPVTRAIQFLACSQHQKPHSTASLDILTQDSLVCGDGQTFWNNVPLIQSNQHSLPSFLMSCLSRNRSLRISFNCLWARRATEIPNTS